MGYYFILKCDLSWRIRTKMGKTEGTILNLQCDCHSVASIFIKRINHCTHFQHFAAKCYRAIDKWSLPQ